ncbi:ParB family protein [Pantoea sp. GM01]|uniref:ParB family protein n=1 Tax=Pantoea sp. GM01 TaxID=1144320 RepID=UPI000270E14F|nr:ParB family protein [Pantoea sp. GM01]EJL93103.1 integrating conjugative element, PFGI-1 class, ParB family protein [Pantoea sp. GM01]
MKKAQQVLSPLPDRENITHVFTLDQLCPNPDNPRKTRNPRFDDIKSSIRARGLESVPLVTRDPRLPEGIWTFSDGGNTRYAIMRELWDETGDTRFYRMTCVVKPWAGRFQCLTGHLAENETHGQLTFIDKALSVQDARQLLEEERGKKVSLRELASALTENGLPVHYSSVCRMEDVVRHLYPWMPELLRSGFGGQELRHLLKLRKSAESVWEKYQAEKFIETDTDFTPVFGMCCSKFDDPELWSLEMFRDELIGDLTQAFPCEDLNYDGWLLELKGNSKPDASDPDKDFSVATADETVPEAELLKAGREIPIGTELQQSEPDQIFDDNTPDFQNPDDQEACAENRNGCEEPSDQASVIPHSSCTEPDIQSSLVKDPPEVAESQEHAVTDSLWHVNALQDDIDHLQNLSWRLSWEIASAHGCGNDLEPACESETSPGFRMVSASDASDVAIFLASLTGTSHSAGDGNLSTVLLIGSFESVSPLFNDEQTLTLFRLIRILRRLRELQRLNAAPVVPVNEG